MLIFIKEIYDFDTEFRPQYPADGSKWQSIGELIKSYKIKEEFLSRINADRKASQTNELNDITIALHKVEQEFILISGVKRYLEISADSAVNIGTSYRITFGEKIESPTAGVADNMALGRFLEEFPVDDWLVI